jgi:peptidoglycan/xylan/chitin deacetylase (PgdA/CDA1 family)
MKAVGTRGKIILLIGGAGALSLLLQFGPGPGLYAIKERSGERFRRLWVRSRLITGDEILLASRKLNKGKVQAPAVENEIQTVPAPEDVSEISITPMEVTTPPAGHQRETLITPSPPALSPVSAVPFYHGPRSRPRVALTFDSGMAGGERYYCHRILDRLVHSGTPATFFLTGQFMRAHPGIARRISRTRLFELGNHSDSHCDLACRSVETVYSEIKRAQDEMYRITGTRGRLFRAPYGSLDGRVCRTAADLGLRTVQWDVSPPDYDARARAEQIRALTLRSARNGSVIVLHMGDHSQATLDALDGIIEEFRKREVQLVTISALMAEEARDGF